MQVPINATPNEATLPRLDDPGRLGLIGENLLQRAQHAGAAAAFEQAEALAPRKFRHFASLAYCYLRLNRPDTALRVCNRGSEVMPDCSDLLRGVAFTAAEALLLPLARDLDGSRLLAACDELPAAYANCTVAHAFRAIALSRLGRTEDARKLVDLDKYVAQIAFTPPEEFGGIERFNELLAEEILHNSGLRHTNVYGFHRTEHLDIKGARAFPALAKFLNVIIARFIAEFPRRGWI